MKQPLPPPPLFDEPPSVTNPQDAEAEESKDEQPPEPSRLSMLSQQFVPSSDCTQTVVAQYHDASPAHSLGLEFEESIYSSVEQNTSILLEEQR